MIKIFLSPSTQDWNPYKTGGNEEFEMRLVCAAAKPYLVAAGYEVKIGGTVSAATNVSEGNSWGADLYVAVHSNAGGGDGTVAFYYSTSEKGKRLATKVYDAIAPLSPGKDDGVKANNELIEIHGPKAPSTLVEVEFHDSKTGAAWIKANEAIIGKALAKGILAYYGKELPKPTPIVKKGKITATKLNVRSGPSVKYSVLGTLSKGDIITLGSLVRGWYKITYKGHIGYIYSEYVKVL